MLLSFFHYEGFDLGSPVTFHIREELVADEITKKSDFFFAPT